jgi:RecB family exonuclease
VNEHAPSHLSWSRIRSYLTCSLAYFFRYIAKEKPEHTPGAFAFGAAVHRAIESALVQQMAGEQAVLDELLTAFSGALDESETEAPIKWSERETRESVTAQARSMLEAWLAHPRAGRVIGVEESFEVELMPGLRLTGRADLITEEPEVLVIADVKTSRSAWGEEQVLQGQDQLVLYREGLRPIIEAVGKPVKLQWEVLLKQKAPRVDIVELADPPPTADRAIRTATVVQEAIAKQIFVPAPGIQCHGCPFRSACRAW